MRKSEGWLLSNHWRVLDAGLLKKAFGLAARLMLE